MNNKVNNFLSAIGLIRRYKKIKNINELKFSGMLHILNKQDLRNLDLNQIYDRFSGKLANPFHGLTNKDDKTTVVGWTEDVLWPINDKMPKGFEPKKILDTSKKPQEMEQLHKSGINGSGISIAIIDERLAKHPEYADNVKYYEQIGDYWGTSDGPDFHGSLVAGYMVGNETGSAPGANLYYFAANSWGNQEKGLEWGHGKNKIQALKRILEINKTLSPQKKIRFVSGSWGTDGFSPQELKEFDTLAQECKSNGIMLIICHRDYAENAIPFDPRYGTKYDSNPEDNRIGVPTNGRTTPYYQGGYVYLRAAGNSSIPPYLSGVYACALQGNELFFTRPNWQDELDKIMQDTVTKSPNGDRIINPVAIRKRVTEITREMEMNLIKQKSTQHE